MRYERYDGRGMLVEVKDISDPPSRITETGVRIAALEKKTGITKADIDAVREALHLEIALLSRGG